VGETVGGWGALSPKNVTRGMKSSPEGEDILNKVELRIFSKKGTRGTCKKTGVVNQKSWHGPTLIISLTQMVLCIGKKGSQKGCKKTGRSA